MPSVSRALISVSDKRGVVDFARGLAALGTEILSTGGTAKALAEAGVAVVGVEDFTGFPEMLDGRVKTLHPRIHAGILHRRNDPSHQQAMAEHSLQPIDLVVVNLYPFEQTVARPGCSFADAIENIDIGGPSLLRAAAKNHADVGVVVDPDDYPQVLEALRSPGSLSAEQKLGLAKKAFRLTARYDGAIADYLGSLVGGLDGDERVQFGETVHFQYVKAQDLRYGENPHQQAAFYRSLDIQEPCIANARQLQGKELSFNNIVDANAAFELLHEFNSIAAVAIKHTNPCGAATSQTSLADAFRKARACDPVSIFGGIVGLNRKVDSEMAQEILNLYEQGFLEIIIAPGFSAQAMQMLASSKRLQNIRLLETPSLSDPKPTRFEAKSVVGGLLLQERDRGRVRVEDCEVVTQRRPTAEEYEALDFAWRIAKHVKSNAIVLAGREQIVGVGAGQMSRVDSAKIAVARARDLGLETQGSVVGSDAFFPFRDGLDVVAQAGATAVIQPGGSLRDKEVIAAADEHGMAMIFAGMRHFRH